MLSPEWGMCFNPHPTAQGTSWKMGQTESRTGGWEERYEWGGVEDGRSTVDEEEWRMGGALWMRRSGGWEEHCGGEEHYGEGGALWNAVT